MKYYFIAFSLLMSASAIAMENDEGVLDSPPHSFVQIKPIPPVDFTGVPPEETEKVLVDAVKKVNPDLQITCTDGVITMRDFILPPLRSKKD